MRHLCRGDSVPVSGRQCEGYREERRLWCAVRGLHWWRYISHGVLPVFLVVVLLASAVFPLSGCGDVSDKLDTHLNSLVDAERRGEAESFAQLALIDLVDGSVRVAIECVSGQLDAAVEAAERFGTVEAIAYRAEKLQALIPITSLTTLAREESIQFISDPVKPATN